MWFQQMWFQQMWFGQHKEIRSEERGHIELSVSDEDGLDLTHYFVRGARATKGTCYYLKYED
jgi:hypothetical protein